MCSIFEDRHSLKDQIAKIALDCIWVKFIHRIRLCREEVSFLWIMCWKAFSLVLFIDFFKSYLSHCTCTSQFPFFFCVHTQHSSDVSHMIYTDQPAQMAHQISFGQWHCSFDIIPKHWHPLQYPLLSSLYDQITQTLSSNSMCCPLWRKKISSSLTGFACIHLRSGF